jgi:hypothetical protein
MRMLFKLMGFAMKILLIIIALVLGSCSEIENLKNNIYVEGNYWHFALETHAKTGDSVKLYTQIDEEDNSRKGELINKWVYYSSFYPDGNLLSEKYSTSEVSILKIELSTPRLTDEQFWSLLPSLQIDKSLKANESDEKTFSIKKWETSSKSYDEEGNLIDDIENAKSEPKTTKYPYELKYLGKSFYSNPVVNDSCEHYQINFTYNVEGDKYNGSKFLYDYYFHEKYGFVSIKINVGNSEFYEMNLKEKRLKKE